MSDPQTVQTPARILVVDDSEVNRRILSILLSGRGYAVTTADSGSAALADVRSELPDLILLDVMMPDMSGYIVCEQLKGDDRTSDIPVLFVSARQLLQDKVKAFAVGGVDYITKPFHREEVVARVRTHLALRDLHKRLEETNLELEERLADLVQANADLHAAMAQLKTLSGLLPICASCKKIRDDQGYWHQVEVYIRDHSEAQFSHGICPECKKTYFPEYADDE